MAKQRQANQSVHLSSDPNIPAVQPNKIPKEELETSSHFSFRDTAQHASPVKREEHIRAVQRRKAEKSGDPVLADDPVFVLSSHHPIQS